MNWERADQQNANPNYLGGVKNGYQDNCATCSPTYMLRLWGFNVTARNSMNPAVDYLSHGVEQPHLCHGRYIGTLPVPP